MSHRFNHRSEHIDQDMVQMEVNLDDANGEWLGYVMDLLFAAGANDVFYAPIFMKKNRPGVRMQLLCHCSKLETLKEIIFKETTTLGIRYYPIHVHRLERQFKKVATKWGDIVVKEACFQGEVVQVTPEYEDCRAIAEKYGIPLKNIYHEAILQMNQDEYE